MTISVRKGGPLVYLLPVIHILVCLATAAMNVMHWESGWEYIGLVDYPVSIVAVGLAWRYNWPLFLLFVTIGTLWWYFLSWTALFLVHRVASLRREHT